MDKDAIKARIKDWELWKMVLASIVGGLIVAWLAPVARRNAPK